MPGYLNKIAVNATGGGYKKIFPADAAGIYRNVTISNPSAAIVMRQASNTSNAFNIEVGTIVLGLHESADLEIESLSTNTPTISISGSHPMRQQ